jgi:hypothetical protein
VPGAADPAVSPDGTRLAFTLPDGTARQLWVSDLDGTNRRRLTSGPAIYSDPDWAPNGLHLAMCRRTSRAILLRLAVVRADGTLGHLVPGTEGTCHPSWSPDSQLLAYSEDVGSPGGQVRPWVGVMGVDGRGRQRLLPDRRRPDWSPDGRRLAVVAESSGESGIALVGLRDRSSRAITPFGGWRVRWQSVRWAPDGSIYSGAVWENRPDEPPPHSGVAVQDYLANGEHDRSFRADGVQHPAVGGGPVPAGDVTPPAAVTATASAGPARITVTSTLPDDPDAAGILVRYAPGDVPPATSAAGLPGGRSVTGTLVVERLSPDTTYAVSVWPVDWSGNVGPRATTSATTPREVPTSLQLVADPPSVPYGSPVVLTGRLLRGDTGGPLAGAPVVLLGHRYLQPDTVLARLTTDADGRVTSRRLPTAYTRYTLRYDGAGPLQPARADVLVGVRTVVTAVLSSDTVRRGAPAYVSVAVRPVRPGGPVHVRQETPGQAMVMRKGQQGPDGRARIRLSTARPGTYDVNVWAPVPQLDTVGARLRLVVR